MRDGAEGEEVRGRAAARERGVSPRVGSVGLERRADEVGWGVMKGQDAEARGGLSRS